MKIHHRIGRDHKDTNVYESQDYKAYKKAMNTLTVVAVAVLVCVTAVRVSENLSKK